MKKILSLGSLCLHAVISLAQPTIHEILPTITDPTIDGNNEKHIAIAPSGSEALNKLFVFFPGTNATPSNYNEVLVTASEMGYHSIGLSYENLSSINLEVCPQTIDPTCHGRARREIWLGIDLNDSIEVSIPNSIVNRIEKLVQYLAINLPEDNWEQFLTETNEITWQNLTSAGHSQGAGHAAYGSKMIQMERVVMFSWIDWLISETNPLWITTEGATPDSAYFGFIHTGDAAIYNGIPLTWENLGMNPYGEIINVDTSTPPYTRSHSLITSHPIDFPPTQSNYHNATCVDSFTTVLPSGELLYKPVWQYLLSTSGLVEGDPNAQKISPDNISCIDPEILSSENKLAFQSGTGSIWLSNLDPTSGFFESSDGLDLLIDTDATPLVTSFNGPEFGVDANGWSIVYTKPNGSNPQAWMATVNGSVVSTNPLTDGNQSRLSILASKSPASSTRILYSIGSDLGTGEFAFTDEQFPENEVLIDSTDAGVRWIDGTRKFFYIKQSGPFKGQIFLYDSEDETEVQVSDDVDLKSYAYGWIAPEYDELLCLVLLNETEIGIYKDNGNTYWDRILTLEIPEESNYGFIGSPEAFVVNDNSYISFTARAFPSGTNYVSSEIWVMDINPDANERFTKRCDNGMNDRKRSDPESYLGADQVYIYYNKITSQGVFEIWRYATGIATVANAVKDIKTNQFRVFPNPATNYIHIEGAVCIGKVQLVDYLGRILIEYKEEATTQKTIEIPEGLQGVYLLNLYVEGKAGYETHKITLF